MGAVARGSVVAWGRRRARVAAALAVGLLLAGGAAARAESGPPVDVNPCAAAPGEEGAFTTGWYEREAWNVYCSSQGNQDRNTNPAYWAAQAEMVADQAAQGEAAVNALGDPFRYPRLRWADQRGRHRKVTITTPTGAVLEAEVFAPLKPCTGASCPPLPAGLRQQRPPFPAVLFVPGGCGDKVAWWSVGEYLAEAGYVSMLISPGDDCAESSRAGLDYLLASPKAPTKAGEFNPFWSVVDTTRVAVAGQSLGAINANYLGQTDRRVDTIVAFDSCENFQTATGEGGGEVTMPVDGCESRPDPLQPASLRTPTLFLQTDGTLIGTHPRATPPDPNMKNLYYRTLRDKGIETMHVSFRAASHNDSVFVAGTGPFSETRWGKVVHSYYTLAWLDYQLKGSGTSREARATRAAACQRLTARQFDGSADAHSIGAGWFDPARAAAAGDVKAGNVPPTIAGMSVHDRLSFHFLSGYSLAGGRFRTDDMRAGGPACLLR